MRFLEEILHRQPQISPEICDVREPGIEVKFQVGRGILGINDNLDSPGVSYTLHVLAFCRVKP